MTTTATRRDLFTAYTMEGVDYNRFVVTVLLKDVRIHRLGFGTVPACPHVRIFVDGKPQYSTVLTHETWAVWRFATPVKLLAHASSVIKFCIYRELDHVVGQFKGRLVAFLNCATQHRIDSKTSPNSTMQITVEVDCGATLQDPSLLFALHQAQWLCDRRTLYPRRDENAVDRHLSTLARAIQLVAKVMDLVDNMVELRAFCKVAWVMLMSIYDAVKTQAELYAGLCSLVEELCDSLGLIWPCLDVASFPGASTTIEKIIHLVIEAVSLIDEWIYMGIRKKAFKAASFDRRIRGCRDMLSGLRILMPSDQIVPNITDSSTNEVVGLELRQNTGEPRHEARSSAYEVQPDAIRDAAHNVAQHLFEQWQPFALEDPTQRKLHAIERFSSVCDRGMQSCTLKDPDARRCIKTLSSMLRDVWDIVKEQSHSARCVGNRCLKVAETITDGLEEWLRSAKTTNTDGESVAAKKIAIAAIESIETDIRDSREHVASCYKVWQKMNHIRFMLCEYSLYIPQSVLLVGVRLGPNVHGVGAYADVYEGSFKGQRVAIKKFRKLNSTSDSDGKTAKSCYREIAIQHGLSHPNICSFIGATKEHFQGDPCMVMAWCKYSVIKFLEEQGFILTNVHRLLIEVIDGLCYLHQEGIAHGDLHPGNVLVDEEGHIKLSDFGMSNVSDTELSIGTMRPGAMRYMAPEIHDPSRYSLDHTRHTEKSDVYSFGHLCWKIVTGSDPFSECYRGYKVTMAVLEGRLPTRPSPDGQRYICDGLWDIMQKCWQRLPEDRPSTVDLRNELRSLAYPGAPYYPVGSPTTRDDDEQSGLTRYFSMDSTVMSFVSFDD